MEGRDRRQLRAFDRLGRSGSGRSVLERTVRHQGGRAACTGVNAHEAALQCSRRRIMHGEGLAPTRCRIVAMSDNQAVAITKGRFGMSRIARAGGTGALPPGGKP